MVGRWVVLAGVLMTVSAACGNSTGSEAFVVNAVVRFENIEGGCWTLDTDDGARYQPVPAEFRDEGLSVRAALRVRTDVGGFCPGTYTDTVWMERR